MQQRILHVCLDWQWMVLSILLHLLVVHVKLFLCYISKEIAFIKKQQDLIKSQLQTELKYYNTQVPHISL